MINHLFNRSLFGKVFIFIFLAILFVLSIFAYQAVNLQKKSILNSLKYESESMASAITFANTESMIISDEIKILEFVYDFVQVNPHVKSFTIDRKYGDKIVIKKGNWEALENKPFSNNEYKENNDKYKIIFSEKANEEVFNYFYMVNLSGVIWGSFIIELSLLEYNKQLNEMHKQILLLAISILITSIFIAYFIAKMVAKPIEKLNNISDEISNGNLDIRTNIIRTDEIGRLAKSFDKMVENLNISQKNLKKSHDELESRVQRRTKELQVLNETLEIRVGDEIKKRQDQEQILIQQSKLAAMGEMIGNIAHQWRQPLNALGLVMQNIQFSYQMDELDDEYMDRSIKKVNLLTKTMSKTIDDFRNFFKPNKEKSPFDLDEIVLKSINLVESTFEHNNITITQSDFQNIKVFGFSNEFSQTILNVLSNAKDALIENKIKDAKVTLDLKSDDRYGYVIIEDNAGGIPSEIIEKIFEPYFTTKEEGKGTGIGLYMSKIIIEQNMDGKLNVQNTNTGAKFSVQIPLYKDFT